MTFAIIMQVNDGLVLATDSASTVLGSDENGNNTADHVYFNADKLFNLVKGHSVGCMSWGDGSIGNASIATLVKDFRKDYSKKNQEKLQKQGIDISSIADSFSKFIKNKINSFEGKVDLIGFTIAGYSRDMDKPQIFLFEFAGDELNGPKQINKEVPVAINWYGEPEYTSRLLLGISTLMPNILTDNGFTIKESENIMQLFKENMQLPIGTPAMPIQDAIDFVEFLVDFNCKMSKFMQGAQTIGGPTDLAVITKHENFKWIYRKHYYGENLNRGNMNDK